VPANYEDRYSCAEGVNGMKLKNLEGLSTRHFMTTNLLLLGLGWAAFLITVSHGSSIDSATKVVDALFKIAAVVVGTLWALNRHFAGRTDALQLRVDSAIDVVRADELGSDGKVGMLFCRLDIVNTGKTLTPALTEFLEVQSVRIETDALKYEPIWRWPRTDSHPSGPIEPGSWSAISFGCPVQPDVRAVRIYIELQFENGEMWNWHRFYKLQSDSRPNTSASEKIEV
jgi:hypothetical protein